MVAQYAGPQLRTCSVSHQWPCVIQDRIARASEVDVVPKIGPNETVVPGVEFKHPGARQQAFCRSAKAGKVA